MARGRVTRLHAVVLIVLLGGALMVLAHLQPRALHGLTGGLGLKTQKQLKAEAVDLDLARILELQDPDESEAAWTLQRATQHAGTGARVLRFLDKARRGEPFTVAALGGSVSKGRGLTEPGTDEGHIGAATLYSPQNLHVLVFQWLNATFPHSGNRFVNGAQGGVGAGYFAWCFNEHIPLEPDLVLLELGINDVTGMDVIPKYERLVRSVLELDSAPAIINIETFTPLFPTLVSSSALHGDILAFYDVPSLSIRDILLPHITEDPGRALPKWFRTGGDVRLGDSKVKEWGGVPVDLMHISALGHRLAAALITSHLFTQLQILRNPRQAAVRLRQAASATLPSARLTEAFAPNEIHLRRRPVCRSMNSPIAHPRLHSSMANGTEDGVTSADDTQMRGIELARESRGWTFWAWDEKRYLVARAPGARAVWNFDVPAAPSLVGEPESAEDLAKLDRRDLRRESSMETHSQGASVAVGYQRSAVYGLGSVLCWIDSDRANGRRLDGYWTLHERNMGIVDTVAKGTQPGRHSLTCELLSETKDPGGGREFRIFAFVHD